MSFPTKVVLGARGLLVCLVRILCGVAYFAPFLGLGNCLAHWVAEGKSLSPEMIRNLNSTDAYWDSATVSAIYRSDYTDPENPIPVPYTAYTILPLRAAFALFIGFFAFQSLLVLSIKRKLSPHFKSAKWTSRLQHLMMANVFPDSFKDWEIDGDDEVGKNVDDYKKARCEVTKEVLSMILVQLTTNMALLTPIFMTSKKDTFPKILSNPSSAGKVRERHNILLETIGVWPQETIALERLRLLCWVLPTVVGLATLVDLVLVLLYLYTLHPWKIILKQVNFGKIAYVIILC